MSASQTIVDEIRQMLHDPEGASSERLERIAREFAERRRFLDDNLSEVIAAAKSGAYCEAARIAETRSVREEANALNFLQWEEWRDICRTLDLEIPTAISPEKLTEFDAFEERFAILKRDLRKLRRASLARADVSTRLDVLYRLNNNDPGNPIWERSIRRLEKFRIERIEKFLREANKSDETEREIEKLSAEVARFLTISEYPQLSRTLKAGATTLKRKRNERDALALADEWERALETENADVDAVSADYLKRWRDFLRREKIAETDLPESVVQAVSVPKKKSRENEKRVRDKAEFERKLASTRRAVERETSGTTVDSLRSKWDSLKFAARNVGESIPSDLRESYQKKIASLEKRRKRLWVSRSAIFAAVGLALVLAVSIVVRDAAFKADAVKYAKEIEKKLDEYEGKFDLPNADALDEAKKLAETRLSQTPKLDRSEIFQRALERLESLSKAEKSRAEEFESKFAAARNSLRAENRVDAARLEELKSLATTKGEREKFDALRAKNEELARKRRETADAEYAETLRSCEESFKGIRESASASTDSSTDEERLATLDELSTELKEIPIDDLTSPEKRRDVSPNLTAQGDGLKQGVDELAASLANKRGLIGLRSDLRDKIGDFDSFSQAFGEFAEKTDDAEEKKLARQALDDLRHVERAETWNRFVDDFGANVEDWDANEKARDALLDRFERDGAKLRFAPEFTNARRKIEKANERVERDGGRAKVLGDLKACLQKYSTPLWLFRDNSNDRYFYLTQDPKKVAEKTDLKYQVDLNGKEEDFDPKKRRSEKDYQAVVEAPQYATYRALEGRLNDDELDARGWFELVAELATRLAPENKNDGFDPTLKAIMLAETMKLVGSNSDFSEFSVWAEKITGDANFELDGNYFRPDDKLKTQRTAATRLLRSLVAQSSTDDAIERARRNFEERCAPITARYRWIGCLRKGEDGEVGVLFAPNADSERDGTLWVCRDEKPTAKGEESTAEAKKCGEIAEGRVVVEREFATGFDWSPVYRLENADDDRL